jgi:hypothetical protein
MYMNIEDIRSCIPQIKAEIIEAYRESDVNVEITSIDIDSINERFFAIFGLRFSGGSGIMFMCHRPGYTVDFEKREMAFIEPATSFSCIRELMLNV